MAKIWEPQSFEVLKHWLNTILDEASDDLNDWEERFISEIGIRIDNGWQLTELQEKKLESIYMEKTK